MVDNKPWIPRKKLSRPEAAPLVRPDFRPEFLDFERGGIRMGNIEPNQRITQIVKAALEDRHQTPFIIDKWGRGVYWKWICWLPRESRNAKPISNNVNFGCAKFYVSLDGDDQTFEAGLQIERAPLPSVPVPPGQEAVRLHEDWDMKTLVRGLRKGTVVEREISRLVRSDGFTVRAGAFAAMVESANAKPPAASRLKRALEAIPPADWGGFQLCYVFQRQDVANMGGQDIVEAILSIFSELVPLMNAVMTVPCLKPPPKA